MQTGKYLVATPRDLLFLALLAFSLLAGSADAKPKRKQQAVRVICIGNSITYGTGLADPATYSYPSQLQRLLGDGYEVGNFGKPSARLMRGGRLPYIEQKEFADMMQFHGDIAIIHLGINDTDPHDWPNRRDRFVSDYCELIDSVRASNPACRVILAQLTPLGHRHKRFLSGTRDWHALVQKEIVRVAELRDCELINFGDSLNDRPDLFPDAVHPNQEGYAIMARNAYRMVTGDCGGLQLPLPFTSNMVLPRNRKLPLKGTANAGETVTVEIGGQRLTTQADNRGRWRVELQPLAQGGPYTLEVQAPSRTIRLDNILAGEVWLCSGQSNMEFELYRAEGGKQLARQATDARVRLFDQKCLWRTDDWAWPVTALDSVNRLQYFQPTQWQECTPDRASQFSAIALLFARELADSLQCPVGVICNAIGGSGAEAWVDRSTLKWQMPEILPDYANNDFLQEWVRSRIKSNIRLSENALQRHPYQPAYLYEASIAPLSALPINGVLWYQGESNAHNMEAHERLFPLLVESWRKTWNQPRLPFLFVQLSSLNRPSWTWFRDSQRRLADRLEGVEMVVSTDCGDSLDVHPRKKLPVAQRLVRQALCNVYGRTDLCPSGPLPRNAQWQGSTVLVEMTYGEGMHASDGGEIKGFELAHDDGIFFPAQAEVVDGVLRISSPEVSDPRYVRYAWQPFTHANLVNQDNLPASTFRLTREGEELP